MVQSSSEAKPDLQELPEEVREISEGPNHTSTITARRRGREFKKGKGVGVIRRNRFRKIREKLRLFLAKFSHASQEPITLSNVLIPEREDNAEITQSRFGGLF